MKKEDHWLYLQDEFPRIGSGWRKIDVTYGRKWVYLECQEPSGTRTKYKVKYPKWNEIVGDMMSFWKRNKEKSSGRFDTFTDRNDT